MPRVPDDRPEVPSWADFAVCFEDDDATTSWKFFRTGLEARRWASWCDHPVEVIDLREAA